MVEIETMDYIDQYRDIAVVEMHRTGIPASITMAQAVLESGHGQSSLATNSKNHFGIKCKKYWIGKRYYHPDDDFDKDGTLINSCFRVYETVIDSYVDHSHFLQNGKHYDPLFSIDKYDYKAWAHGLKKCGYATNPKYGKKLISIIEKYNLQELDYRQLY